MLAALADAAALGVDLLELGIDDVIIPERLGPCERAATAEEARSHR